MSYIPFNRPRITGEKFDYIRQAIENMHISGDGLFTKKCHILIEQLLGVPRALLTTSCTHALEMGALLLIALMCFFGLYEIYARPGWVDSAMYLGYAMNPRIYNVHPLMVHNYQGSRLGYIVPLNFLMENFGIFDGRLIYVVFLYSAYIFSVMVLARFFINKTVERILVCILFILNPGFISSIFYGGADGPAAVQLLLAVSLLICAITSGAQFKKHVCAFLSGFFLLLSVSSHIFAAVPCVLIFPALIYHLSAKRLFLPLVVGMASALYLCTFIGDQFGLDKLYFLYSLPWAKHSIFTGIGKMFVDSLDHRISNAIFWIPIFITILFFRFVIPKFPSWRAKTFSLMLIAVINIIGPIMIYTFYDVVTKGNTFVSPAYFNTVYPSFVVGLVCMISLNIKTLGGDVCTNSSQYIRRIRCCLILILLTSIVFNFTANHIRSVFSYNNVDSESFYRSEIGFMERIKSTGLDTRKAKFVLTAIGVKGEGNPRVYKDHYNGSPRYQDYLDSLVGLFLWDRSILLRLLPENDLEKYSIKPQKNTPVVFLARNKDEVHRLVKRLEKFLRGYTPTNYECYDDKYYPWCFVEYEYELPLEMFLPTY